MLFLECNLYWTSQICKSWKIRRFCGNWLLEVIWGKNLWDRRNFFMRRTRQICVHRWWLTVPYSLEGLLVQPQCHVNIDMLDLSWLLLDSWEWISNWSHPFVPSYLKREENCMWENRGKEAIITYTNKGKCYCRDFEIFPFPFVRTLSTHHFLKTNRRRQCSLYQYFHLVISDLHRAIEKVALLIGDKSWESLAGDKQSYI